MLNPLQANITGADGEKRFIIIEPMLETDDKGNINSTGRFKIFKDALGEESALFTEPLEIDETSSHLADDLNPDYLGLFTLDNNGELQYKDGPLNATEQGKIAAIILKKGR